MKLLVTGGLGFIGSNLCRHILTKHSDYELINIDKIGVGANPANLRDIENEKRYKFIKGDIGLVGEIATRIQGSPDLYYYRGPTASINFITAHDGFTLHDLVSYDQKHNEANLEHNRDGSDSNISWNCGIEGPTDDPAIKALRARQKRNFLATLLFSQGVPMLLAGDELGRTQRGNNNAYCQDNEVSWVDWNLGPDERVLLERFVEGLQAWGGTSLNDAVHYSLGRIKDAPGRKALIVFSDGADTTSTLPEKEVSLAGFNNA